MSYFEILLIRASEIVALLSTFDLFKEKSAIQEDGRQTII